jgi:NAD(P)-dependent dehydrogenase (short-subunit alcohol dehydrogenase family)
MTAMLQDKVALISGGARGIGRATALLFAQEGARVAVADMNADGVNETAEMIRAQGGEALALTVDVSVASQVAAMTVAAIDEFGRLDCAFNNAGVAPHNVDADGVFTADWTEEAFDRMIAINVKGVWLAMREQIPLMQENGGAIVNTASIAGLRGLKNSSAYAAAKHAVIGLTKTAAMEYAGKGIRCNAVCPGFIDTDMTVAAMKRSGDAIIAHTPMRRQGTADEIAQCVAWLCSDRASYVNGAAYTVDGGYSAM